MADIEVNEVEAFCREKDGIRVVFRANSNEKIPGFSRKNAVKGSKTISEYRSDLESVAGGYQFTIIDGYGNEPHGNTHISKVRETYEKD